MLAKIKQLITTYNHKLIKQQISYFLLGLAVFNPVLLSTDINQAVFNKISKKTEQTKIVKLTYPIVQKKQPKAVQQVRLTAYSSTPDQTSGNPFITASGTHVHDGTIAANCLPFGTKVKLPNIYGDKTFIVEDRLAARMGCGVVDIWFPDRGSAINFGNKYNTIEIY